MKYLLVLAAVVACAVARPDGETYDTKYDDFDVTSLLGNERLLKSYGQCLLDKGPCTAEGKFLREVIPDALETDCAKCSEKQQALIKKIILATKDKFPEDLEAIKKLYDPEHKYEENVKKWLES
uniref:Putative chemosensory protein 11 n=1 Tax=Conopomorpha sinensis TaxID=940481 RepID=A0A649ZUR0_9NEOP|nr:putative chemosensory protein 11 [Conopomorpha sinensis]WGJ79151.1 chemosensory protein 12 [Conopomorpha sinensis]